MTDRLDDEIISDLIAQGNIVGIRMKRLKDELERVTAERDEYRRTVNEDTDALKQAHETETKLRAALEVAKKTIRESAYYSPRVESNANRALEEIERLEAGRGKE